MRNKFLFFFVFFFESGCLFLGPAPWMNGFSFFLDFRVWKNTINSLCCVIVGALRQEEQNKTKSRPSHDLFYMCRVLPKAPTPACDAPLLNPACSPMCPSWARNCSSLNSRSFLSAILGPRRGPLYSGCFCVCKKFLKIRMHQILNTHRLQHTNRLKA